MSPGRPRPRHLSVRSVLDYLEHRLDAAARRRVDEHLGQPCAACREQLRAVGELLGTLRHDRAPDVPAALHERALAVFEGRGRAAGPRRLLEALARLVFDSRTAALPAAARRSVGEARRLRFALADQWLDCELEPEGARTQALRGTFATDEPALWTLEARVGPERRSARLDATGAFALTSLPAGVLELRLEGPEGRFRLPPIEP